MKWLHISEGYGYLKPLASKLIVNSDNFKSELATVNYGYCRFHIYIPFINYQHLKFALQSKKNVRMMVFSICIE